MNTVKITTIDELITYLKEAKGRIDRLKKRNPDLTFGLQAINDLPVDFLFEVCDKLNETKSKWSSDNKVSEDYDKKHLSVYISPYGDTSIFPIACSLRSVEIEKLSEPVPTREMYKEVAS